MAAKIANQSDVVIIQDENLQMQSIFVSANKKEHYFCNVNDALNNINKFDLNNE